MFSNNLSYEIKLLVRSKWLVVLLISVVILFSFAAFNGTRNVNKRVTDIVKVQEDLHKKDSTMLSTLSKIERGEELDIPYWQMPSEPMTVGYRHPRLAIMEPDDFAFLSTGQSDMYTHFKSPTVYGNNFALDYSEMVNPVQLLFGNFDLAFVIIYILPLFIIAFTFNILSKEKELGTLRLLAAQPISTVKWLLQKMAIRYLIFTIISLVSLLISIGWSAPEALGHINTILGLFVLIAGYNLFWFVVSFVINIKINNSSKNTFALIGIWLLIVLVLPASINQIGSSVYPTPSRLKMINDIRLLKKQNEEKQNEIMSEYLRNHPEMTQGSDQEKFGFWHNYFASEKLMEEQTKPLLAEYEQQLKKQQDLIGVFEFLSPAILMQQSLNKIAGTSEMHYNDYKKQVYTFSSEWRNYFVPMLFKEQKFNAQNYQEMPKFNYENRIDNDVWISILILTLISAIVLLQFGGRSIRNKSAQKFIN